MADAKGKKTERLFAQRFEALGKQAYLHRFEDAADTYGLNKRLVMVSPRPADYLGVYRGKMFLCEVKETSDRKGFKTSLVSQGQRAHAVRVNAAGGLYLFVVGNPAHDRLFVLRSSFLLANPGCISWDTLAAMEWHGGGGNGFLELMGDG